MIQHPKIQVVSVSGGRSSGYLVYLMEQKRKQLEWQVEYVFMDTGAEHPNTYQFLKDMVSHWKIKLHCIRTKVNPKKGVGVTYQQVSLDELRPDLKPWAEMLKKYGAPTIAAPRCTSRMKTEPHDKFCDARWGRGNYNTWLGIRIDEDRRLGDYLKTQDLFKKAIIPVRPIRYLAELSSFDKAAVNKWWQEQPFDLQIPDYLGNCVFCIKKSLPKLYAAVLQEPELARAFEQLITSNAVRQLPDQTFAPGQLYREHSGLGEIIETANKLAPNSLALKDYIALQDDEPGLCEGSCEAIPAVEDFVLEHYA